MPFKGQPPIQNKLLQKHWEERDLMGHHERLANMKPRMNTQNPSYAQNKKAINAKKQLTQECTLLHALLVIHYLLCKGCS